MTSLQGKCLPIDFLDRNILDLNADITDVILIIMIITRNDSLLGCADYEGRREAGGPALLAAAVVKAGVGLPSGQEEEAAVR